MAGMSSAWPAPEPDLRARRNRPAITIAVGLLRKLTAPARLPHRVQLCVRCRASPAGFWVTDKGARAVRRPWCLSCCDVLDRGRYDVTGFES
jgi:hypothetical protein